MILPTLPNHHVVTLGTAGGPRFWKDSNRQGIATAVVVDDGFYLVDCGHGVGRQLERAGLSLNDLKGVFITHLHSDHVADLNTLVLFSLYELEQKIGSPIPIFGPGERGMLPSVSQRAKTAPCPVASDDPTPGTSAMFRHLIRAFATDLNDRILDSLRPSPFDLFEVEDIAIPSGVGFHPNDNPTPVMEPFEIFRDANVVVSAILVEHPPVAPAFGYRFETNQGSVAISGDTTFTPNMVRLAHNAGLILHEAIDFDTFENRYANKNDATSWASMDHHYKSHTSVHDAVRVAKEAGAYRLALHHLGPGNNSANKWNHLAEDYDGEFFVPNDLDVISFAIAAEVARSTQAPRG